MTCNSERIHSSQCEDHVKKKCASCPTNCTPVRKRITDEELMKQDPSVQHKILRSVARPNYCETNKRPRRSYYLDGVSLEGGMCSELEAASEENHGYGTRSKDITGSQKAAEASIPDKMAPTDSDDAFSAKNEDISNHSIALDSKSKKGSSKASSKKGTAAKNQGSVKIEHNNVMKNESECQSSVNQVCPICQEILPDNHAFTLHIREHNVSSNNQSHVCQICQKKLSSASSLDRHMYVHSGERPFKCSVCYLTFTTNGNMHRHMRTHSSNKRKHANSGSEKSEDEEIVVPQKKVYRTSDDSNSQTFKCPVCNKRFISTESLEGHMRNHPNDAIECCRCNMVSENYAAYNNHMCLKLESLKVEKADFKVENECVVGFRDLNFVEFSIDKFSLIAKNACEKQVRRPSSAFLAFECHICGKAFPCIRTLDQHEAVHNNKEVTFDDGCSNSSPQKYAQWCKQKPTDIIEETKTKEMLKSDKDSFLATLGLQKVAVKVNSTNLQPFLKKHETYETQNSVCNIISASDREISKINFKQNCLTENNDFADIPSIISLTSKTTLPNMRTSPVTAAPASPENGAIEQNPESPVIEGSANSNFEGLNENANSRKDPDMQNDSNNQNERFQCRQCSLSFSTMKTLRGHIRSHTQNGPHCCDFCPYKSVDKSTLLRHMRTHNGERPFKCSLCDYAFTTKANSHRHVKKKHKLPDNQVASAVVYNPNMLDTSTSENVSNDNSGETVCKYCKVDFKFSRVLRHHLRSVNNSCNYKPFLCRNCTFGFSTKNNCIRHINQKHPEFKDNINDLIVFNQPQPDISNDCNQTTASISNETSTEEDEPSSLYIVHSEDNNDANEPNGLEKCLEEQNNSQVDIFDQNLIQNIRQQVDPQENAKEYMSQHLSYNVAHDHHNSCSSEDDRVSIAQSLVSLSEGVMFQVAPLDLSVRAIDLSSKNSNPKTWETSTKGNFEENSFDGETVEFVSPPPAHNLPLIRSSAEEKHLNASLPQLNFIQNQSNNISCPFPTSVAALPLLYVPQTISSSSILNSSSNGNLYISNATCLPTNNDAIKAQNACMSQMKMVKKKLVSNQRSYKCEYCDGKFTLKSNRERHVKKQHPEFARPARSRNFIPFLPEVEVLKQAHNVSDTTKNRLRSVLIPKVSNSNPNTKSNENDGENFISDKIESVPSTSSEMIQLEERKDFIDQNVKHDFENNDLASVSSVIDTANSQVIKKYLTSVNFSDSHSSAEKVPSSSESEMEDSKFSRKISTEKSREPLMCEYCSRTFPWISALNRHLRTHTGAKPFTCLECPVTFSTKSNLDRHIRKKCCDKINFRYKSSNRHQKGHGSNSNSQGLKNGIKSGMSLGDFLDAAKKKNVDARKKISHRMNSMASNNSKKPSSTPFNTSLNTVAHVASLQLQSLHSTHTELECKFCQNTYNTDNDLKNHIKELHPLEHQSLTGETMDQTRHTMISWKKNSSTKKKETYDKSENSKDACSENSKDVPLLPNLSQEPNVVDVSPNNKNDSDTDNNLIMDLLGVEDSKVIDEIIDSAARTKIEKDSKGKDPK